MFKGLETVRIYKKKRPIEFSFSEEWDTYNWWIIIINEKSHRGLSITFF